MRFIPLGDHCCPSLLLKKLELRTSAYPYDWVMSADIDTSIVPIILQLTCSLLESEDYEKITNTWMEDFLPSELHTFTNKLGIAFPHENPAIAIDEIRTKYIRRFQRLLDHIREGPCVFILCTRFMQLTSVDILLLQRILNTHPEHQLLLYSGVSQPVVESDMRIHLEIIPYNRNDYYDYDYSVFRPTIETRFREWMDSKSK